MVQASPEMQSYFDDLERRAIKEYEIATLARQKGLDPKENVEVTLARNIGERVEGLLSALFPALKGSGLGKKVLELEQKYEQGDWRVAFAIAEKCVKAEFIKLSSKEEYLELGVRAGLAYLTQGTVSAPLEGIVGVKAKPCTSGGEYIAVYYAGPIRAAGGTPMTVSVVIVDFLRKMLGYKKYDPTPDEIKRYIHELQEYHDRISRLQYYPSEAEVDFLVNHIPIEINGSPTSKREVMILKDAGRVETPQIRGGMCLALAEGVAGRAKKLLGGLKKFSEEFDVKDWDFLEEFVNLQKKQYSHESKDEHTNDDELKVKPSFKFLKDAVAGRPIFSCPSHPYGFRIRYGRTRVTGIEAYGFNPVTSFVLNKFMGIGTQLSIERPGKGCTVTVCEAVRGPVIRSDDGEVARIDTMADYNKYRGRIQRILFLGDVLINFGAFREHKHLLVPSPFVEEWWLLELKKNCDNKELINKYESKIYSPISYEESKALSLKFKVPMHPQYIFHWNLITLNDLSHLIKCLENNIIHGIIATEKLVIKHDTELKSILEKLLLPHCIISGNLTIEEGNSKAILDSLGYDRNFDKIKKEIAKYTPLTNAPKILEVLNAVSKIELRDVCGFTMGARMGRPEKAKMRKMTGSPHMLFPVGEQGGRFRSLNSALDEGFVKSSFPLLFCKRCNAMTVTMSCEKCGEKTEKWRVCRKCKTYTPDKEHCGTPTANYESKMIDITKYFQRAVNNIKEGNDAMFGKGFTTLNLLIKGVKGVSNEDKAMEIIEKGVLRAYNNVYVNKDGTIRLDMTQLPITHFKPKETTTSINKLKELGYTHDMNNMPLETDSQIVEIKPQDIILPACKELPETDLERDVTNITKFLDTLLEKVYKLPKNYNVKTPDDLAGILGIALAPHTSAGTLVRIIGFSKTQGGLAHPLLHAATRRDCDGDEVGFMLLLDAFINFSHDYLPNQRGTKNMDCPLVLALTLDPSAIDDEVFNMDIVSQYNLQFYQNTLIFKDPFEVPIEIVEHRLEKDGQFENYGFTHPVENFNDGIRVSSYKTLPTMDDKVGKQMDLAFRVNSIDASLVATLVIEKHLLRDIKGNLRKFSTQGFRCISCNEKFRRVPLIGSCTQCGGKIVLTIHKGSVMKYVEQCFNLAFHYKVSSYLQQSIEILKERLESVFGKEDEKQEKLNQFFK